MSTQVFSVNEEQIRRRSELLAAEFFPTMRGQCSSNVFSKILKHTKKYSSYYDNKRKLNRMKLLDMLRIRKDLQKGEWNGGEGWQKLEVETEILKISAAILEASRHITDDELLAEFRIAKMLALEDTQSTGKTVDLSSKGEPIKMKGVRVVLERLPHNVLAKYIKTRETLVKSHPATVDQSTWEPWVVGRKHSTKNI